MTEPTDIPLSPHPRSLNILLVDDEPSIRKLLILVLEQLGHVVVECRNVAEARQHLRAEFYDLMIADVHLPDGTGIEVLRFLQVYSPGTRTLIVTGLPNIGDAVDSIRIGAAEYLAKPLDFDKLVEMVESIANDSTSTSHHPKVIGNCSILHLIGEGQMGTVYSARHNGELVAVKVMKDGLRISDRWDEMRERFLREARIAAEIKHPNLVSVYDYGIDDASGLPYLIMEYLKGDDLSNSRKFPARSIGNEGVARIICQVAGALEAIHQTGKSHRDVKPANIIMLEDGTAKLTDLGMASEQDSKLTLSGTIIGTPRYLAPEALKNPVVDSRADIYSLGVSMYEMMLGKPPLDAPVLPVLFQMLTHETPAAPETIDPSFPPVLSRILSATLAKDPSNRYPRIAYLERDLHAWLANPTVKSDMMYCQALPDIWEA